jgi:hypothetical protein
VVRYISEFEHIKSRKDFFVALDEALKRTRELGSIGAPDPSMGSILRQLEAVKGWTANDRQPTLAERKSLTAGRILVREFEPAPTDEIYDWVTLVREVTGYFSDWLDDATFATIDTDDMDDFD